MNGLTDTRLGSLPYLSGRQVTPSVTIYVAILLPVPFETDVETPGALDSPVEARRTLSPRLPTADAALVILEMVAIRRRMSRELPTIRVVKGSHVLTLVVGLIPTIPFHVNGLAPAPPRTLARGTSIPVAQELELGALRLHVVLEVRLVPFETAFA